MDFLLNQHNCVCVCVCVSLSLSLCVCVCVCVCVSLTAGSIVKTSPSIETFFFFFFCGNGDIFTCLKPQLLRKHITFKNK